MSLADPEQPLAQTQPRLPRHCVEAVLWWAAAAIVLAAGAVWLGDGPPPLDRAGLVLAHAWRGPWLDMAFKGVSVLGSLAVLLPVASVAVVWLWRRGHRAEAQFLILALGGAAILVQVAKHLALRSRPELFPALVSVASPLSFPSGHAAQAMAFFSGLLAVRCRLRPRHGCHAAPVLVAIVLLVGLSRNYLQVHYPSDVLAGILAAGCWVLGLRAWMLGAKIR